MRRLLALPIIAVALAAAPAPALAQADGKLELGMFAPAAPFGSSDDARRHLDALAAAIEKETGRDVSTRVFFRWDDLARAKPDLAVIDAACVAAKNPGRVIAAAVVEGSLEQTWGLYANEAASVQALKGERVAVVQTGCRDDDFVDHALLSSELPGTFFGPRLSKRSPRTALESVTSGGAAAAFAPLDAGKGSGAELVYRAPPVPTPALVVTSRALPKAVVAKVTKAVVGASGGGGIDGWRAGGAARYKALGRRMKKSIRPFVFAAPARHRLSTGEAVVAPSLPEPPPLLHLLEGTP